MAGGIYKSSVSVCFIVILALQTWNCAAYNNQQMRMRTHDLSTKSHGSTTFSTIGSSVGRHLGETTNGYRASLVNHDHQLHSRNNLSPAERIAFRVQKSKARAFDLDSKVRATYYKKGTGRKTLESDDGISSRRKVLQSYESPVEVTPGSYSMALSLGTPAQNMIAIADTGSDLVWIQCKQCTTCFDQSSPLFDPTASSTYADLGCTSACNQLGSNLVSCSPNCQYSYSYGDQSTTRGNFALETVSLADSTGVNHLIPEFQFGCGLQNQGTFQDTDGIVGLARGPVSFASQVSQAFNGTNIFSYCLVSSTEDANVTSPIIFGPAAVSNATGTVYTPQQTPYDAADVPFYYATLTGITVGATAVDIPASAFALDSSGNGGTIFDSGTTYTVLVTAAYTPVLAAVEAAVTYSTVDLSSQVGLDLCFDVTGLQTITYPSLIFNFENADFDLPFDNIFTMFSDGTNDYMCLTLLESSGMNIYGNTQQQNFQVVYDEDALRLGWVPVDCTTV